MPFLLIIPLMVWTLSGGQTRFRLWRHDAQCSVTRQLMQGRADANAIQEARRRGIAAESQNLRQQPSDLISSYTIWLFTSLNTQVIVCEHLTISVRFSPAQLPGSPAVKQLPQTKEA